MFEFTKALKTRALSRGHVSLLPSDDRNLRRCHGDQRWGTTWPFDSNAGCPKLNDVLPNVAITAFAVPFKFLKAGREPQNPWHPTINPLLISSVQRSILTNEVDLPIGKLRFLAAGMRWQGFKSARCRLFTQLSAMTPTIPRQPRGTDRERCFVFIGIRRAKLHRPNRERRKMYQLWKSFDKHLPHVEAVYDLFRKRPSVFRLSF